MSTLKYWVWLTTRQGLLGRNLLNVLQWFGTPEGVYFANPEEYEQFSGMNQQIRATLQDKDLTESNQILGRCEELGIRIVTYQDAGYPERLRNIYAPPLVLYVKGKSVVFDENIVIGMVGTRKCTPYGTRMGGKIAYELAKSGAVVVSGIAEGIDTACIKGALSAGGSVVSVLGGGIDVIYPRRNWGLFEDLAVVGTLISEYPPGTAANGPHFPIRNRIISGLSLGVVVVESDITGGSMHTVNHVEDQNRDLFAVPGPADAQASAGPNRLIAEGAAKLITCGQDILQEYTDRYPSMVLPYVPDRWEPPWLKKHMEEVTSDCSNENPPDEAEDERIPWSTLRDKITDDQRDILLALEHKPRIADDLVELTQIPTRRVLSALTILEMQGYVTCEPGKRFRAQLKLKME